MIEDRHVENLKLLAAELRRSEKADLVHNMNHYVRFGGKAPDAWTPTWHLRKMAERSPECETSCCSLGRGALSDAPELKKTSREDWDDYSIRVYGLVYNSLGWRFCFSTAWFEDTPELAARRVDFVAEHMAVPDSYEWSEWGAVS